MKTVFINEIRIDFSDISIPVKTQKYCCILEPKNHHKEAYLTGSILVVSPTKETIKSLVTRLLEEPIKGLKRITFLVNNEEKSFKIATKECKLIEAAGGIVEDGKKLLLIKRFGLLDFPKGKIEKEESKELAAVREVEEETGAKVALKDFITETYHTYPDYKNEGRFILKKTYWYTMALDGESEFVPQTEEGIEEVLWMKRRKVMTALEDSYYSLQHLYNQYYNA